LRNAWRPFEVIFDLPAKQSRLEELEKLNADPDFWKDAQEAQKINRERKSIETSLAAWTGLQKKAEDCAVLLELAGEAEEDADLEAEMQVTADDLERTVQEMEFKKMLSGESDMNSAFLSIHAGAGGTEAQDWASMLMRMYLRWAERRGFRTGLIDELEGEEAGIKSATITVSGDYAYGYLKAEVGIHRLVRISPYDANARRHTSFASVFVYPEVDDNIEITIDEKDLRVDTYRASGAGGQHVNKTSSAIRITHIPTNIVVACQNERSQHMNRATAMKMLRARLYEVELKEREKEMDKLHAVKKQIAWGSQIRSYILQPYQLVKDHRTDLEIGNVNAVLDGDIDRFIEAYLMS
jgi:peptide chain release factor 2